MEGSKEHFEDPGLKSAVCRCWGCECAPAELHAKIRNLCNGGTKGNGRSILFRIPRVMWALSAAAIVVIVVSLALHPWNRISNTPSANVVAVSLPSPLQADLVNRHDLCCSHGDHQHLSVSKDDDSGIVHALQRQLGRAVLVARPTEPGWIFRGAAVCPVGAVPSGHLIFARGTDTLSVFSLPLSVAPQLKDGQEFTATVGDHLISGFRKDGALFCLVAFSPSGTITTNTLETMRAQMEPAVEVAQADISGQVQFAELLRPVVVCQNRN